MYILSSQTTTATLEQFWKAVDIWNTNPHVVNRRLCGAVCLFSGRVLNTEVDIESLVLQIKAACVNITNSMTQNEILLMLCSAGIEIENTSDLSDVGVYIFIKKLMPRNSDRFKECLELAIIDKLRSQAIFVGIGDINEAIPTPPFLYSFCYIEEKKEINLKYENEDEIKNSSLCWLKEQLFSKLLTWAETAKIDEENIGLVKSSLNLVNITKYNQLYQQLKKKYGPEMVKIWPENTDPLKFVYEDVAIATYLLLLWEQERLEKGTPVYQKFVDLGCGNGLLVHILNSEGHTGIGLDVRKRAIWDLYPSTTKLEVRSIVPSSQSLFPDTDWLIGNHSDELTPWIPVIAARSSYTCQFFLLPCCCYEFSGRKYQRQDSSRSQYEDYLHYIYDLCQSCGFITKPDRLRIPSTKRLCFVGFSRTFPEEDSEKFDREIQKLIDLTVDKETKLSQSSDQTCNADELDKWSQDFTPRENTEKVRNCTQLEKNLIQEIVSMVANALLCKQNPLIISVGNNEKSWNKGGSIHLGDLASLIPNEKLKKLKNECGGLQTLLKNNGHIFVVQSGQVQFKTPSVQVEPVKKKSRSNFKPRKNIDIQMVKKQKPCWFHFNHPDGCPLLEENCSYKH